MKGQVSIEYLILMLVSLSLLSISVFALFNIKSYAAKNTNLFMFKSSALSLSTAIREVCALGSGNVRSVDISVPLSIEFENSLVRFSASNSSIILPSHCEVESYGEVSGTAYVKNRDGIIFIEQ